LRFHGCTDSQGRRCSLLALLRISGSKGAVNSAHIHIRRAPREGPQKNRTRGAHARARTRGTRARESSALHKSGKRKNARYSDTVFNREGLPLRGAQRIPAASRALAGGGARAPCARVFFRSLPAPHGGVETLSEATLAQKDLLGRKKIHPGTKGTLWTGDTGDLGKSLTSVHVTLRAASCVPSPKLATSFNPPPPSWTPPRRHLPLPPGVGGHRSPHHRHRRRCSTRV